MHLIAVSYVGDYAQRVEFCCRYPCIYQQNCWSSAEKKCKLFSVCLLNLSVSSMKW